MALDYSQLANAGNILSSIGNLGNFNGFSQQTKHDVITVNGYAEAKDFKLNKGERVALIDANDDILYIKECDEIGKYNLKVFQCINVTDNYVSQNTPAQISRAEFEQLNSNVAELKQLLMEKEKRNVNVKQQQEK